MSFTDQQLSAYLDGELPEDEVQALEAALKTDAGLREALARLQNVDDVLTEALSDIADEAVPEHILAMVKASELDPVSDVSSRNVVWMAAWKKGASRLTVGAGLAASMIFGWIIGGQVLAPLPAVTDGVVMAGLVDEASALHQVLETVPSGTTRDGFTPALSFAAETGVCREVAAPSQRALACREAGRWTVLVVTADASLTATSGYQTASAQTSIIFDVMADQLMTEPPLTREAEALRLQNGWQEPVPSAQD